MTESEASGDRSRSTVVRDVFIFQAKLWLEGFKDIVLMPLSLGAAVIDLVFRKSSSRSTLYSVMKLGDRFEQWVHLYAAIEGNEPAEPASPPPTDSLDDLLNDVADGLEKGGSTGHSGAADARGTGPAS